MATFYNQATLSYRNGVTNSNVTAGEFNTGLSITKTAVTANYGADDGITYVIAVTNPGYTAINNITLTDNLGAYTSGTDTLVPLDYVEGSLRYYVNGTLTASPTVSTVSGLSIGPVTIPAGGNVIIVYEAQTNGYAPLASGSQITNTVTTGTEGLSATSTVPVNTESNLTISKAISPTVVGNDGNITYTFVIQNSGNTAATAEDNIVITDVFDPAFNDVTVTLNGTALVSETDYTYVSTSGEFATVSGVVTVPAATYTTDSDTGIVTVTPGVTTITVSGSIL